MTIVRRAWIGDLEVSDYPYGLRFGADLGNADADVVTLESLLADGQIESLVRRLNRGMSVGIVVQGADLAEVQANEAALVIECDRRQNTLTIDLGDDFAEPMVFETTVIDPQRVTGEGSEAQDMATLHLWTLAIRAQPFWRSATKIIDNAGTPPSSGTVVYACESTTGWSSTQTAPTGVPEYVVDTAIFTEGAGSIRSRSPYVNNFTCQNKDKVSGLSISTGTGGYLSFAIRIENDNGEGARRFFFTTTTGGRQEITNAVAIRRDANNFVHYSFPVGAGLTVTELEFWTSQPSPSNSPLHVWYDDFEFSSAATTDHQIVKQLDVQGSARTTGSLHIAAPSDSVALDKVLVITTPTDELPPGFTPDGERWVVQGTTTADTSSMSGHYYTPDAAVYSTAAGKPIFDVPVGLLTAGPYIMVGLVKAESSSLTFGVQSQLRIGTTNAGPTSVAEATPKGLTVGWQFVIVGTVYLPPLPMQNADSTAKVRLLFKGAKFTDVYFIPAWEVGGRPVADFSIVDCGSGVVATGGPSSNLWIDSPSTDQPQGGWWRGPNSARTGTQSAWPDAKKPGVHAFRPGGLTAFLVSTGAQGPTLALEYFDRYL